MTNEILIEEPSTETVFNELFVRFDEDGSVTEYFFRLPNIDFPLAWSLYRTKVGEYQIELTHGFNPIDYKHVLITATSNTPDKTKAGSENIGAYMVNGSPNPTIRIQVRDLHDPVDAAGTVVVRWA